MTRKDYNVIAAAISEARHQYPNADSAPAYRLIVDGLADYLAADNPRFDRDRFIAACQS